MTAMELANYMHTVSLSMREEKLLQRKKFDVIKIVL